METATQVQNLDEAVGISHVTKTLSKDMNSSTLSLSLSLSPAMDKIEAQSRLCWLGTATSLGEGKLTSQRILLVQRK